MHKKGKGRQALDEALTPQQAAGLQAAARVVLRVVREDTVVIRQRETVVLYGRGAAPLVMGAASSDLLS